MVNTINKASKKQMMDTMILSKVYSLQNLLMGTGTYHRGRAIALPHREVEAYKNKAQAWLRVGGWC